MSRSDRSHGCEVTKRRRGWPAAIGRAQAVDRADAARRGPVGRRGRAGDRPSGAVVDVGEARLGRQVVAVRVDVLAEQRDLAIAGRRQRAGLGDDVVERPAPLRAAAERDDAVGARLVAAVDDRQPGARSADPARDACPAPPPPARVAGRWSAAPTTVRPTVVVVADRADRRLRRGEAEAIDQLGLLVRPQEQVDGRVATRQPGAIRLADGAAGQHDAQPGVGGLEPGELALPADDLLLGALADGAGVDDDEVGGLDRAAASSQPAASSRPAISSESLRFIWQPSVQTWKRGRARVSGRYSARRSSVRRRRQARRDGGGPGIDEVEDRQGARSRVVSSVTAGPWYAERRDRHRYRSAHGTADQP